MNVLLKARIYNTGMIQLMNTLSVYASFHICYSENSIVFTVFFCPVYAGAKCMRANAITYAVRKRDMNKTAQRGTMFKYIFMQIAFNTLKKLLKYVIIIKTCEINGGSKNDRFVENRLKNQKGYFF